MPTANEADEMIFVLPSHSFMNWVVITARACSLRFSGIGQQVNPNEAWTARRVKEKIAADGKRHCCQKKVGHDDNVHTCKCGLEWKQW
jgi:hypothetical protein